MSVTPEVRNQLMIKGDWRTLAKLFGIDFLSEIGQEAGMHKAILEITALPDETRRNSLEWLRQRGMTRSGGIPLPEKIEDIQ